MTAKPLSPDAAMSSPLPARSRVAAPSARRRSPGGRTDRRPSRSSPCRANRHGHIGAACTCSRRASAPAPAGHRCAPRHDEAAARARAGRSGTVSPRLPMKVTIEPCGTGGAAANQDASRAVSCRFRDAHLAVFRIDEEGRRIRQQRQGRSRIHRRAPRSAARRTRRPTSRVRTAADPPTRARRLGCRRLQARARSRRSRITDQPDQLLAVRPVVAPRIAAAGIEVKEPSQDPRRLPQSGTCASGTASARDTPGN